MNAAKDDEEYCVTCPKCGRVIQKSFTTDSIIKCSKCSYEFYAYISDGVAIAMDAAKIDGRGYRKRLLTYVQALSNLKESTGTDG